MKTLYFNGQVYTHLEGDSFKTATAILVEDGVIKAVGSDGDCGVLAAGATAVDLKGKAVLPGFNDSHLHLMGLGKHLTSVNLMGCQSVAEVVRRGSAFIAQGSVPPGGFITGRGWNQDYFKEGRLLTRADLDAISTDYPVVFRRACGHMLCCNTRALDLAGVTSSTPVPEGGVVDLDTVGKPSGIFREHAMQLIEGIIPQADLGTMMLQISRAMDYAACVGITSVQTNDINDDNYSVVDTAYRTIAASNKAKLRVNMQFSFTSPQLFKLFLSQGYNARDKNSLYKLGTLKLFVDGSLGARTALMRQPYADCPDTYGVACMSVEDLEEFVSIATAHNIQVITHAIGDRAVELVLDTYEKCGRVAEGNLLRHGVVHAQITDTQLVQRFSHLNVLALVQPIFLHYDMHIVKSRVGQALAQTSYAFGTMYKSGVPVSFGTDCPVEDLNPFDNLHCAVTRRDLTKKPQEAFVPSEAFTLPQAVDCYTNGSAYSSFEEKEKGTLLPGMLADFVVLDRDIFSGKTENIQGTQVVATVMNGALTYGTL